MAQLASTRGPRYITTRPELIRALREAAELEQQLMLQYLYAVFSLKKHPDEQLRPDQLEHVRRWASVLYMVARQEMEHLSLVCNLLSSIGAQPFFGRENFGAGGLLSPYFQAEHMGHRRGAGVEPVSLPYVLSRFDAATMGRFVCFESPSFDDLPPGRIPAWCFEAPDQGRPCVPAALAGAAAPASSHLSPDVLAAMREGVRGLAAAAGVDQQHGQAGLLQLLYEEIRLAMATLPDLYVAPVPQVDVIVQYNIDVFPVTNRQSALAAIDLILKQGEGIHGGPTFDSHFMLFYDIHDQLERVIEQSAAEGVPFEPSLRLLENPTIEAITDPFTREVFALSDYVYETLVLQLTALYRNYVPVADDRYPFLSTALAESAFAPFMTMLVRSLNEVLVRLPAGDGVHNAGPSFTLSREVQHLLGTGGPDGPDTAPALLDIDFHLARATHIRDCLQALAERVPPEAPADTRDKLAYMYQSAYRVTLNLVNIYQVGKFPKF